jgi:SAM-dependent methyltransferase
VPASVSGTEGYGENAPELIRQYESLSFQEMHGEFLPLLPPPPGLVLDIGAGSGRDAAALAALGHYVVAVEPTPELRAFGARQHANARLEWVDDALPDLERVHERGQVFDLVLLIAVWMHLDAGQQACAMQRVAGLLAEGGRILLSLRHGPVPPGRRMFEVSGDEVCRLAETHGLQAVHRRERADMLGRGNVTWTFLAFVRQTTKGAHP